MGHVGVEGGLVPVHLLQQFFFRLGPQLTLMGLGDAPHGAVEHGDHLVQGEDQQPGVGHGAAQGQQVDAVKVEDIVEGDQGEDPQP